MERIQASEAKVPSATTKIFTLYESGRLITAFTTARQASCSDARKYNPLKPNPFRYHSS
jgi:hypothetical protein